MNRAEVLDRAKDIVIGHRETEYGSPEDSFNRIAALWTAYLGNDVGCEDVAIMMILLKIARLTSVENFNPYGHMDSWIDIAGYAACGAETASRYTEVSDEKVQER